MPRAVSKNSLTVAGSNSEIGRQQPREVFAIEGRRQRELRIVEADVLELDDPIGDVTRSNNDDTT